MHDYENLNKYFNTTPKTWFLVLLIWSVVTGAGSVLLPLVMPGINLAIMLFEFVRRLIPVGIFAYCYYSQFALKTARVGRSLLKQAGGDKEIRSQWLEEMNNEVEQAQFSLFAKKFKGAILR